MDANDKPRDEVLLDRPLVLGVWYRVSRLGGSLA